MGRDFQIAGEVMVRVKGNGSLEVGPGADNYDPEDEDSLDDAGIWKLGLSEDPIVITPKISHKEIYVDSFGPSIPAELLWLLAEATIRMTLIHYDPDTLLACWSESMAGSRFQVFGELPAAGIPMGGGAPLYEPGNHWIGVSLTAPVNGKPWVFPACVLSEQPITLPMGTGRSAVQLVWRAIPYVNIPSARPTIPVAEPVPKIVFSGASERFVLISTGGPAVAELRSANAPLAYHNYDPATFTEA